jgi:hypothetical protein
MIAQNDEAEMKSAPNPSVSRIHLRFIKTCDPCRHEIRMYAEQRYVD